MQAVIDKFNNSQSKYIESKERSYLKDNSQFFTPINIAEKMITTIDLDRFSSLEEIDILEPSAGCGALILAIVNTLISKYAINIKVINLHAYETDSSICEILKENLKLLESYLSQEYNVALKYKVFKQNFILSNSYIWLNVCDFKGYDIIISNPPFKKITKASPEAVIMNDIVYGQPNMYNLFIGMSLKLLKPKGVYTTITPRSYLSGKYSLRLREFIFNNYTLTHLHSFDNRYLFSSVNQEVIISTYENKNSSKHTVNISHNGSFKFKSSFKDIIYNKRTLSLSVPRSQYDLDLIKMFSKFKNNLNDLNIKVSVGPVVQFRNIEFLKEDTYSGEYAPLIVGSDIQEFNIINYFNRANTRKTHNKSINVNSKHLIKNSNYLILRKVTAKDDINPLIASVLDKAFFNHSLIGLDNNLLYFHKLSGSESLSLEECYGLYCYICSKYFKALYSLINGTHTINVSDFEQIPFPNATELTILGSDLINSSDFSEISCNKIFENVLL